MTLPRIALVVVVFALTTYLFKIASGSLKFTKLNMISTIYYYMMGFNLIGCSLVYLGFREHYLIKKIQIDYILDYTYYALAYTMIAFPIVLIIVKKMVKSNNIETFIKSKTEYCYNCIQIQGICIILIAFCTASTIYVFNNLDYTPLITMFKGGNINALRQSGSRYFTGNIYIKNLFMLLLTPFVSYLVYIYYKLTKTKAWGILFIYSALLSIVVLTYDFSKAPIITYLLGLYLLDVVMGNIRNPKGFLKLATATVVIILFFYVVVLDAGNSFSSIYTGPVGRIVFSQIGTLFLHLEAFPLRCAFMDGASFNSWMSFLIPNAAGIRSGRVVMTIYNAAGVKANTAGVMNTVFIGEAYANYGLTGVLIAPVVFGIIIGIFAYILPNIKKTPVSILVYVQLTLQFVTIVEGGFVDIFYSASILFILFISVLLAAASEHEYLGEMQQIAI